MKAMILAAGRGERLRPLTDTVPKCLVPINGRPLLSYWMTLLERHGFDDVIINVHHLPDAVRAFADGVRHPRLTLFNEPQLLGSAGTVRANRDWVADGASFLIAYADDLSKALSRLADRVSRTVAREVERLHHPDRRRPADLEVTGAASGETTTLP